MKIVDSRLQLQSTHRYVENTVREESLHAWVGDRRLDLSTSSRTSQAQAQALAQVQARVQAQPPAPAVPWQQQTLELSAQALALAPNKAITSSEEGEESDDDEAFYDLELSLIKALVEQFSGHEIELMRPGKFKAGMEPPPEAPPAEPTQGSAGGESSQPEGWGLIYDFYAAHQEEETTRFSAAGEVRTADGQAIQVELELGMSRQFASEQRLSIRAGDALKDPLVVNYAGTAASLTQRRFAFDLDQDGRLDQIAFVNPGSGFLALDKNSDGQINDGAELFGPSTGSGFAELAVHDEDGNGWIDAADSIYSRLRIWSKDEEGNDRLVGLGQVGIGAVYLGHVETPFLLKDGDNRLQGQVSDTGLFLREDGSSGTLQELDLVVY